MTPLEAETATKAQINALGAGYMFDKPTRELGKEHGYRGMEFYFAGRGGVLGECDADVVKAAFGWFSASLARTQWEAGSSIAGPKRAAELYNQAMANWGAAKLAGVEGVERFAELGERMVAAVGPDGLPLFVGWRAMPRSEKPAAHAYQIVALLRELRGSAHVVATMAQGLTDVEAIVSTPGHGPDRAERFGHEAPFPEAAANAEAMARAEATTDHMMERAWAALDDAERAEMVELTARLHRAAVDN